jgi:xanthine/uracil/vitamin C permease (AzgA family)
VNLCVVWLYHFILQPELELSFVAVFISQGSVSYQAACTAVMIEGAIFFVLALTGLRYRIIRLIPEVSMLW